MTQSPRSKGAHKENYDPKSDSLEELALFLASKKHRKPETKIQMYLAFPPAFHLIAHNWRAVLCRTQHARCSSHLSLNSKTFLLYQNSGKQDQMYLIGAALTSFPMAK